MLDLVTELPLLTTGLPGTGGRLRTTPEDFRVVEIPAYEASGEGDHVLSVIEKRDLTTAEAVRRMAAALGAQPGDVGFAGMKDRHAVTRQQLSFPPPITPEAVLALQVDGVRVLAAARHPNKLRTGHLRGNQFTIVIRDPAVPADEAAARARAVLDALATPPGSPNWFGAQRFGRDGETAALGRALIRGERLPGRPPRGRQRRLHISAYQSLLFNEYLRRRIAAGAYRRVLAGDLLRKPDTGGVFASTDPDVDQARLEAGEVAPTGPMYGHQMRGPEPGSPAAALEQEVLAAEEIAVSDFARARKLATGTRRAIAVPLDQPSARALPDGAVEVDFALPAGGYATAVLSELVKGNAC